MDSITVGERTKLARRNADVSFEKHENSYDSGRSIGIFYGAMEHDSSGNESLAGSLHVLLERDEDSEDDHSNNEDCGLPPT